MQYIDKNSYFMYVQIRIPYQHITSITKEMTAVVIPNAIAVTTQRKNYIFRSFWDRDDCFGILSALLKKHRDSMANRDSTLVVEDTRSRNGSVVSGDGAGSPAGVVTKPKNVVDGVLDSGGWCTVSYLVDTMLTHLFDAFLQFKVDKNWILLMKQPIR